MTVVKRKLPQAPKRPPVKINEVHDALVLDAQRWLRRQGCAVVLRDALRVATANGELPDAIGWRDGLSLLVEAKVSRSDFLADRKKPFRQVPEKGVGDWRFFICPEGVISPEDLPPGWGLIWVKGRKLQAMAGVPGNTGWWSQRPFTGNKRVETQLLVSALRRLGPEGLESIYDAQG